MLQEVKQKIHLFRISVKAYDQVFTDVKYSFGLRCEGRKIYHKTGSNNLCMVRGGKSGIGGSDAGAVCNLIVKQARTQYNIKNLQGRSIRLDIFAKDSDEKEYNVEIQREDKGAGVQRARYNSSLLDANAYFAG